MPRNADDLVVLRAARVRAQVGLLVRRQFRPLERYAVRPVVGQDRARIGRQVSRIELIGCAPLRRPADVAGQRIELVGEQVAAPALAVEQREVDLGVRAQGTGVERDCRRRADAALDRAQRAAQARDQLARVLRAEVLASTVPRGVAQVVDSLRVREVLGGERIAGRDGPRERARAVRRHIGDIAVDAERDRVGHHVLFFVVVDAAGCRAQVIVGGRPQVVLVILHRDVREGIRGRVTVGTRGAAVPLGVVVAVRVAHTGERAVVEAVGHQDVEVLLAFAARRVGQCRARSKEGIGLAAEVLARLVQRRAERRAVRRLEVVQVLEQVVLGAGIRVGVHRRNRDVVAVVVVQRHEAHARILRQRDDLAVSRFCDMLTLAVVGEPVREVLDFLGVGTGRRQRAVAPVGAADISRCRRDDLDERASVLRIDDVVTVGVGPDEITGRVEGVAGQPVSDIVVGDIRRVVGDVRRQVDRAGIRIPRVDQCRVGYRIAVRNVVLVLARPRYIGHGRIVVQRVVVLVPRAPPAGVLLEVAHRGQGTLVGRNPEVVVIRRRQRIVVDPVANDHEATVLLGHQAPVHRARVVEREQDVRLDRVAQKQR